MPDGPQKKSAFVPPDGRIDMSPPEGMVGFVMPIKSRIIRVGTSGGVLIPSQIMDHYGFRLGDFVSLYIQHRTPSDEEVEEIERRAEMRRRR